MPVDGKPNGRFELPALSTFDFNLTDGTDIPPPLPDSPIEEESIKSTTAREPALELAVEPPTTDPVRSTYLTTPPASSSANSQSDLPHLTVTKSNRLPNLAANDFSNLTTTKSNGYLPPTAPFHRNDNAPPIRLNPASHAGAPNHPKEKASSIRKFLSRKSFNASYTNVNKSHEDLSKLARPDSPKSQASSRPSFVKRKSGSWFRSFGGSSRRNSVVFEEKAVVYTPTIPQSPELQKENFKPVYTKPKPGPPPPKLPELNQLKARIADDDRGSLGGDEMFRNIS
ncbi:hypothetical protein DSL72_009203 [Monilinia vaccinii-corymbosi]|uniref:Uncharacterized protein n=1 Tax=Monilinia vaccinii-corymbosi TaxID=61207 RepID=A0A8A3PQI0_9HELO|nr:hypothetical protein DSL72_009203 [Monilinia vaccinii-corymbosi]